MDAPGVRCWVCSCVHGRRAAYPSPLSCASAPAYASWSRERPVHLVGKLGECFLSSSRLHTWANTCTPLAPHQHHAVAAGPDHDHDREHVSCGIGAETGAGSGVRHEVTPGEYQCDRLKGCSMCGGPPIRSGCSIHWSNRGGRPPWSAASRWCDVHSRGRAHAPSAVALPAA
jgi:hypothetical protein